MWHAAHDGMHGYVAEPFNYIQTRKNVFKHGGTNILVLCFHKQVYRLVKKL